MYEDEVVCIRLMDGSVCIGKVVDDLGTILAMSNVFILEEFGDQITLRRYDLYASSDSDMVQFYRAALISLYRCSDRVSEFYNKHVEVRRKHDDDLSLLDNTEQTVIPTTANSHTIQPSDMIDIDTIRREVIRYTDNSEEE